MATDKEAKKQKGAPEKGTSLRSVLSTRYSVLHLLLGVALVLGAVVLIGELTRAALRDSDRYTLAFTAIDCPPPPAQDRATFLSEVQYLAEMPDQLRLLDDDLARRLAEAFARHPWVERVERVALGPQKVHVRLAFRTPVLAVPVVGQTRAVDGHGILLPPGADVEGLPVYDGQAAPPAGPAGTLWGDAAVEAAARTAAAQRP
jgi:hypothetical protein